MILRIIELPISATPGITFEAYRNAALLEPLPDVVVFPELFSVGFDLKRIPDMAYDEEEISNLGFADLAIEGSFWLAGGTVPVCRPDGRIINRFHMWNASGKIIYTTEKVHLFRQMGEDTVFSAGHSSGTFDLDNIIKAGAVVCYDLRFPELFRKLTLAGAELIIVPAQWPDKRKELFLAFLSVRAAEAQVFVAGCNIGGDHLGVSFRGGGSVAKPSGEILEFSEVSEYVKDYSIDSAEVEEMRSKLDCLADRRPEEYGVL